MIRMFDIGNDLQQAYDDGYADGQCDRWISVDDVLPTETGHYLVAVCEPIGEDGETTSFVLNAWYNAETFPYSDDLGWTLLNEFYEFTTRIRERITHWMPLPKPPVVEVDDG